MKATIITIGNELLIGQVVNTNAAFIAEQCNLAGIEVDTILVIPDERQAIIDSLEMASGKASVVIISGGLGPTSDDITKKVLMEYFGSKPVLNQEVLNHIIALFRPRGFEITEVNRQQAMVPDNCRVFLNTLGTAPGMWFEKEDVVYISVPGVPFEMKELIMSQIIPQLKIRNPNEVIIHHTILTQGVGESRLSEMIVDWEKKLPTHISLAYLPQPGIVRLRLTGKGANEEDLKNEILKESEKLKTFFGDLIWGYGDDTLEKVVGELLLKKNATLSTAESCTGGYIAHLITLVPGSSAYYNGSVVAYSNNIKESILGVKQSTLIAYGAVSEQVVVEMAQQVKNKFQTDYSIAVSGIAGPDGGTKEKPVGTVWIAIGTPIKVIAKRFRFSKDRERNIRLAAVTALNMLRREIIGS